MCLESHLFGQLLVPEAPPRNAPVVVPRSTVRVGVAARQASPSLWRRRHDGQREQRRGDAAQKASCGRASLLVPVPPERRSRRCRRRRRRPTTVPRPDRGQGARVDEGRDDGISSAARRLPTYLTTPPDRAVVTLTARPCGSLPPCRGSRSGPGADRPEETVGAEGVEDITEEGPRDLGRGADVPPV